MKIYRNEREYIEIRKSQDGQYPHEFRIVRRGDEDDATWCPVVMGIEEALRRVRAKGWRIEE